MEWEIMSIVVMMFLLHVCCHSELIGPIRRCDTCLVEVDGKLVRSCARMSFMNVVGNALAKLDAD